MDGAAGRKRAREDGGGGGAGADVEAEHTIGDDQAAAPSPKRVDAGESADVTASAAGPGDRDGAPASGGNTDADAAQLEAFKKTAALGVPVSTVLCVSSLVASQEGEGLSEILEGLVRLAEELSSAGKTEPMQRALLDVVEFMVAGRDKLCSRDRAQLTRLRKAVARFEDVLGKVKSKLDYRAFSIFMENKVGDTPLNKPGPVCSEFNKLKSKLNRGTTMTWEERDKVIEKLLSGVHEKRRGFLAEGRDEVRGYSDMSDQELLGWETLVNELRLAEDGNDGGDNDNRDKREACSAVSGT